MSSLINKAKDKLEAALQKDNDKVDNPQSSNVGPHSSNITNKVDPRVDSDRDHRNDPTSRVGGYGETQTGPGYGGGAAQSDTYGSAGSHPGYDDPRSGNTGPHKSNIMNKMDPRVDSDADGRNNPTSRVGGYGNTQQVGDNYGTAGGPGGLGTTDTGYGEPTTGGIGHRGTEHTGHTSHAGHTGHTGHSGQTGLAAATTTGLRGSGVSHDQGGYGSTGYDDPRSANTGPHGSNILNKVDPRVDSDRDHRNDPTSRVGGYGTQERYETGPTGTAGGYGAPTGGVGNEGYGTGPGGAGYGDSSYTPGSGNTAKTAGPHDSNIMNKLDPRVDSDMDGSKTYGGNQTYR